MLIETLRQHDDRTERHRSAPEICQELALNTEVFDVARVYRRLDWRNFLRKGDVNGSRARGVDMQALGFAKQIARLLKPLLAFSHVGR